MKMRLEKKAIDKMYKRRDRIDMPEYQRQKVWPRRKKRLLIDSILKGWRMPKSYFLKLDDSKSSPGECGPEEFRAAQLRILNTMGSFLRGLM